MALDQAPSKPPSVGERLIYAIGDVHGRLDLLQALVLQVVEDAAAAAPRLRPSLILLGDYIDRGPQSAEVLAFLLELSFQEAIEVRLLRGNHEQTLLDFLDDPDVGPSWTSYGGAATLASFGVAAPAQSAPQAVWAAARDQLARNIPRSNLRLLAGLEMMIEAGDYLFVHAGLRPGRPMEDQAPSDLLWIRSAFAESDHDFGKVVVHGHMAAAEPRLGERRIGIDTGAYATGVLTALRLQGQTQRFLRTGPALPAARAETAFAVG